jgi:hypothetical protein
LGVGLRVAGRIAGERLAGQGKLPQSRASGAGSGSAVAGAARSAGASTAQASRGLARGIGGLVKPFGRVGGILWLEVTGSFFLLLGITFACKCWTGYQNGFIRWHLAVEALVAAMFFYLGLSSFWRARQR